MRFIIDGPDGAGKNLLCQVLQKTIGNGNKIIHLSHDNFERPYDKDFYNTLFDKNENAIFNRSFFSEIVYSRVKTRPCDLSYEDVKELVERLRKDDSVIFHVTNEIDILQKRLAARGDTFINAYELTTVKSNYDIIMDIDFVSVVKLNLQQAIIKDFTS